MNIKQAKIIANEALTTWSGFEAKLPEELLTCCAGNIKFNNWTQKDLFKFFEETLTSKSK